MARRTCDSCGHTHDTSGGKTCESGHFICKDCYWAPSGVIIVRSLKYCPLCNRTLR
ncbi:MAG: hypothetical protein JWO56_545 [Acidobacteria bacterium]|nr:hypothetical protein [Acidobacteriota bacterium]